MYKVASGDLKSSYLIEHLASFGKPLIISSGGADMSDVRRVIDLVLPINSNVCLLQCTAAYPCDAEDMNLGVIDAFKSEFPETLIGLSSHDNGIMLPVVAQTLGARVFEKHFTLNRAWKGTDHSFSLIPEALRKMIRDLHRARASIGDGVKRGLPIEQSAIVKMAKKIVAAREIRAGQTLTLEDLAFKSPGDGLFPCQLDEVLGRKVLKNISRDDAIEMRFLAEV
jgi:sialic acid synthase